MQTINKTIILDQCISGSMKKYKTLLNPMCDQFNTFYDVFKTIFVDDALESSVDQIVFSIDNKTTAVFSVSCTNIENINIDKKYNKRVNIVKTDDLVCFNVQPNK